jgi:hypothetical protein
MNQTFPLPGMETVSADRAAASNEAVAVDISIQLHTPLPSISRVTGEIEKHSPLFRESDANPQPKLF